MLTLQEIMRKVSNGWTSATNTVYNIPHKVSDGWESTKNAAYKLPGQIQTGAKDAYDKSIEQGTKAYKIAIEQPWKEISKECGTIALGSLPALYLAYSRHLEQALLFTAKHCKLPLDLTTRTLSHIKVINKLYLTFIPIFILHAAIHLFKLRKGVVSSLLVKYYTDLKNENIELASGAEESL